MVYDCMTVGCSEACTGTVSLVLLITSEAVSRTPQHSHTTIQTARLVSVTLHTIVLIIPTLGGDVHTRVKV